MEYLYGAVLFPTKEKSKVGEFEWEMRESDALRNWTFINSLHHFLNRRHNNVTLDTHRSFFIHNIITTKLSASCSQTTKWPFLWPKTRSPSSRRPSASSIRMAMVSFLRSLSFFFHHHIYLLSFYDFALISISNFYILLWIRQLITTKMEHLILCSSLR